MAKPNASSTISNSRHTSSRKLSRYSVKSSPKSWSLDSRPTSSASFTSSPGSQIDIVRLELVTVVLDSLDHIESSLESHFDSFWVIPVVFRNLVRGFVIDLYCSAPRLGWLSDNAFDIPLWIQLSSGHRPFLYQPSQLKVVGMRARQYQLHV
jgi:hypothetical protein